MDLDTFLLNKFDPKLTPVFFEQNASKIMLMVSPLLQLSFLP